MAGYSKEFIEEKIGIYKEYGISTFPGGIPFQVALLQRKVEDYFKRVAELGFQAIEISEDMIPHALTPSQRQAFIELAKYIGLEVFTELGRKFADAPLQRSEVIESVLRDLKAGAKKVVIENSDLVKLKMEDPGFSADVLREVGKECLVFGVGPGRWPTLAAWLIRTLGPDINIENVADRQIITLDAMHRQLHWNIGYAFFSEAMA